MTATAQFYGAGWQPIGSNTPPVAAELDGFALDLDETNYPELLDYVFTNHVSPKVTLWADGLVYWLTEVLNLEIQQTEGYGIEPWGGPVITRTATVRFELEPLNGSAS
ncbi:hypothetical protein SEA_ODAY_104 [Gordonia phage ODay]|nr:hypothetical protein SEA_ODAY_104 [Gordonia phage ODay]